MKNILFIILLFPVLLMGQSKKENYVKTVTYKKPSTQLIGIEDTIVNVTYYDGLGRTKQVIAAKAGGNGQDIVVPVLYDSKGRQATQYLPYANPAATAASSSLNYRPNDALVTTQFAYYKSQFPSDFYTGFKSSFGQDVFEQSPLNRVVEKSFPGDNWDTGRKSLKFEYAANLALDNVYDFKVGFTNNLTDDPYIFLSGGSIRSSQYYSAGTLYKTISKNENWLTTDGNNNTTQEFKDKQGRVVLTRQFTESVAHDTYYVYDVFGNLTFVIPPQAFAAPNFITTTTVNGSTTYAIDNTIFQKFSYTYKYDSRNRIIEKYIPGSGLTYMVYDKLDRLIMTQDENMRAKASPQSNWLFTKYDAFGRIIYSGDCRNPNSRIAIQDYFNSLTTGLIEYRSSTPFNDGGLDIYYNNTFYPTGNDFATGDRKVTAVNYYDDYNFDKNGITVPTTPNEYGVIPTTATKSLPTGSMVKVLDTTANNWTTTVNGYDSKGRLIWTKNNDPYFITTNNAFIAKLDFTGKAVETKNEHEKTEGNVVKKVTVADYFSYDGAGRSLLHTQKVNNAAVAELISSKRYNELGQLTGKNIGGLNNGGATLQTIDYSFHLRGWLTAINNVNSLGKDLFAENIYYNAPLTGTALYDGNISQVAWKTANDNNLRTYNYTYDALSRIKTATFVNSNNAAQNGSFELKNVTYDRNGNITFLHRSGDKVAGSAQENMDVMSYEYDGNQLKRIKEDGLTTSGFITGMLPSNTAAQYAYDTAGNLKSDTNKKISNIDYNRLNLPVKVTFTNGGYIEYVYNALGGKLKKTHYNGVTTSVTEYNNGFVYLKSGSSTSVLQYFSTEEGYVSFKEDNTFNYVYQHKDHLGNIRMAFTDVNGDRAITTSEIIEEHNYEPFGLKHTGYNYFVTSNGNSTAQKIGLNGKELEKAEEYNMNEMDWRHYDPAIARWVCTDPVIHHSTSPYSAFENNPLYWSDPSGLAVTTVGDETTFTGADALSFFNKYNDHLDNGSENIFVYPLEGSFNSEFAVAGGGGGGGDGDGLFTKLWKLLTGKGKKGSIVFEELILTSWEVDTEAIGDFVSGGEVTNMRKRVAIFKKEGLNAYLYQSIADAHREEFLNFVGGGYGIGSSGPNIGYSYFDEVVSNPRALYGKTASEVGELLGDGWKSGVYGSKGTGWKYLQGSDKSVFYHLGGGTHKGSYYGFSSGPLGKNKIVRSGTGYIPTEKDKANVIYLNFYNLFW